MRRALLKRLPAMTRFFGVKPWEIELFTADELNEYLRQWDQYERDAKAQQAKAKQRRR